MRKILTLTAAAPLVLLAACADGTPDEDASADMMDTEIAATDPMTEEAAMPPVPDNALETVDYAGDYSWNSDGETTRLTLRDDDTYDYTAPDGTSSSGSYTRMDDGYRIMIEDYDGMPGYFAIGDGALYRLPEETSTRDEITVTAMYQRENAPVQETGPSATTDNIQDKRS